MNYIFRIIRGGGWYDYVEDVRCAGRSDVRPDSANYGVGFRLVRRKA
jgi:formylglycine-generating enzyme required for sulfatase activity